MKKQKTKGQKFRKGKKKEKQNNRERTLSEEEIFFREKEVWESAIYSNTL